MNKLQITNNKLQTNAKSQITKKAYDLEDRTLHFAKTVISFCQKLSCDAINSEIVKQIIRSSASVGANYREANEALGRKDFFIDLE